MTDDIKARLKEASKGECTGSPTAVLLHRSLTAIEALEAEIARLNTCVDMEHAECESAIEALDGLRTRLREALEQF